MTLQEAKTRQVGDVVTSLRHYDQIFVVTSTSSEGIILVDMEDKSIVKDLIWDDFPDGDLVPTRERIPFKRRGETNE